jgi:predicted negative regulator of RcsB-dependent stress response
MDEEIAIIDSNSRNEKIKSFFIKNKKLLILISVVLIFIISGVYFYQVYKHGQRALLSNKYNNAVIEYENGNKSKVTSLMKEVILTPDTTYSPLGLYFLIDNKLINNKNEINKLFDVLINKTNLEKEIKNLIIYKKAIFNANFAKENELIQIVKPIIKSESIWNSHALYLVAEYFYSNGETKKAKEFYEQIIKLQNSNKDIKLESEKRLNRDLSE